MKHIYQYVQIYRQRNGGKYPTKENGTSSFYYDVSGNLLSYGLQDMNAFKQALVNPDNQYVDDPFVRKNPDNYVLTLFPSLRPDGSTLGSPKPKGTLDLLSSTSIYYHENTVFRVNPVKLPIL